MVAQLMLVLIRLYRLIVSPWLGPSCRYFPTCSEYSVTCIQRHGALLGSWYTAKRLCRCHPWGGSGYDPAPEKPGESPEPSQRHAHGGAFHG